MWLLVVSIFGTGTPLKTTAPSVYYVFLRLIYLHHWRHLLLFVPSYSLPWLLQVWIHPPKSLPGSVFQSRPVSERLPLPRSVHTWPLCRSLNLLFSLRTPSSADRPRLRRTFDLSSLTPSDRRPLLQSLPYPTLLCPLSAKRERTSGHSLEGNDRECLSLWLMIMIIVAVYAITGWSL